MEDHTAAHEHEGGSMTVIFVVWGSLLFLTLVETYLAYQELELKTMLAILVKKLRQPGFVMFSLCSMRHEIRWPVPCSRLLHSVSCKETNQHKYTNQ